MNNLKISRIVPTLFIILFVIQYSFRNKGVEGDKPNLISQDTAEVMFGVFSVPELQVNPSPTEEKSFTFPASEKIVDYDVSPEGMLVAAISANPMGKYSIRFWEIGEPKTEEGYLFPDGFLAKAIVWHPNAKVLFVMGQNGSKYEIRRLERNNNKWDSHIIYSSDLPLRRLLVCPRPFITKSNFNNRTEYFAYRLFFGMDDGSGAYRVVTITESGDRFYQVIGSSKTFSKAGDFGTGAEPSTIESYWALPLAFHPGGHQLIWQDKNNKSQVAKYDSKYWGESKPLDVAVNNTGTITPTPNGLGLIHWQNGKQGIGIYLLSQKSEELQLRNYKFVSTPSSVPDGKGVVGLTLLNGCYTLNYVPVKVPLADVSNAWMYADSFEEIGLFQKNNGLFRPDQGDQLYKLYETENYYCNSYDRNSPTRPYLVTTDIFWELFGAAYQGLFIVKERDEAVPNFWKFILETDSYYNKSKTKSQWMPVFSVLKDLYYGNLENKEVSRIQNEKDVYTEIIRKSYAYSDLKPRGHYTSSPEMEKYFKAFRYFTTILKDEKEALPELNSLPPEVIRYAENWITSYSDFIAPPRSPLIWENLKQTIPDYCKYPQKEASVFPLSWGFDNEVLYSAVYHENFPSDLQIKGPSGYRLLPSGLDLATALGNGLAESLLQSDFQKYPPLRKVINNLKGNFKVNSGNPDFSTNLYNNWLNAVAVQWADSVYSVKGVEDNGIWATKRLQTGLATWATLRHATVLVNERISAECGEGGFEEILMRAPRGYVEPDPFTFVAIADLFENAINSVSTSIAEKSDIRDSENALKRSLYVGIIERLKEAAKEARSFQLMAEKERRGESLNNEEFEKILYVAQTGEHLFLVFNSLANKDYALSNPDPMAKIVDVAGDGVISPYLMSAIGNSMEWDYIVPFYGRRQIVKGSVYSYYEFQSDKIINDKEWREQVTNRELLPWIKNFVTHQSASGMARTGY
jgi:hypothetical protein